MSKVVVERVVIVVCPRFPPANAADCHRVRLCARHYEKFGWRPVVLCSYEIPSSADDQTLFDDIAKYVEIIRVKPWSARVSRLFGFKQLEFRCFFPLLFAGLHIMKARKVACVFFSTTAFFVFLLGPIWKVFCHKLGLIYDIQDPWYQGKTLPYTRRDAPGSWTKYLIIQRLAKLFEPVVMNSADQLISVSAGYVRTLSERYPRLKERCTILPFPGAIEDYALAKNTKHHIFDVNDGKVHWVYAGRAGPDMAGAIEAFFSALKVVLDRNSDIKRSLMVHFVGTNYAPDHKTFKVVEPIAIRAGIADCVIEHSPRVRYLEVLDLYRSADVVLLFGSSQSEYTASKIINCVLSQRPLLIFFHGGSVLQAVLKDLPTVLLCDYLSPSALEQNTAMLEEAFESREDATLNGLEPWLAFANARIQCEVFEKAYPG